MHATENSIYYAILIICLVVGCIIGFFIVSLIRQHRKNIELYKLKVSAEISTLEKERARISADLHDDLGPMLSAVKFKIGSAEAHGEDVELLKDAEHYIDDVIRKMRMISNNMLPGTLMRKGLEFAVTEFLSQASTGTAMKISFSHNDIPVLYDDLKINLYRIVQEIVHNAMKHSHASQMKIELFATDKIITLRSSDNGRGFDHQKAGKENTGLGLRNLLSRTELLQGELFIESTPGKGTSYNIEIPLERK